MSSKRARIKVRGAIQGVGFRPFVYRLACELGLAGWVLNSPEGVSLEVEGANEKLKEFCHRLESEKPPASNIQGLDISFLEPADYTSFEIRDSVASGTKTALILPDLAICADCLRDIFDPANRRYLYPFTNCTNCGPRFTIIESLPYDRANTSMKRFSMCLDCELEYDDPNDRRFHAQPNACPKCGPHLELWNAAGQTLCQRHDALAQSARAVLDGQILALKGIGGFQLIVDASNEAAIQRLRARKHRPEKPFALMFPSLNQVKRICHMSSTERRLLLSSASPIVLLEKRSEKDALGVHIAASVAPVNPNLGVMLPYSPLHYLLLCALEIPVIATSGNLSDEPICIDEQEALERLQGIADLFLVHNRPIVRHMDDSIACVRMGREMVLRSARGYAPLSLKLDSQSPNLGSQLVLSVGAHLKNCIALGVGDQIISSQHIGDLETSQAFAAFVKSATDLPRLYEATPQTIACDLHPEYLSTRFARRESGIEVPKDLSAGMSEGARPACEAVQHHYAHVLSCMAEHQIQPPVLGVCWDGTGYGLDGTIWGGEFLLVTERSFERVAHFRQFRLPGGEVAVREPRRAALGLLFELYGPDLFERRDLPLLRHFSAREQRMLQRMLAQEINSPRTSSAGRLFDAVAALAGIRQFVIFEGQAAMELEFAAQRGIAGSYPFDVQGREPLIVDWGPIIANILVELFQPRDSSAREQRQRLGAIAGKFHNTLSEIILAVATTVGETTIVLTGGCFQNKYLLEQSIRRLREADFTPHWHRRVPPNDGGIAAGQIVASWRARQSRGPEVRSESARHYLHYE